MIKIAKNQVGMLRKFSFRHFFEEPDEKIGRGRVTFEHSLVLGLAMMKILERSSESSGGICTAAIMVLMSSDVHTALAF